MVYDFYQVMPLPIPRPNASDSYIYIQPSNKYIALSQNRMTYVLLENLDKCINIKSTEQICQVNNIYSTMGNLPCEMSLLTLPNKKNTTSCTTKSLNCKFNIWEELRGNRWIYVLSNPVRITISCNQYEIYDSELKGTGILYLNETCKGYAEMNQLIPNSKITTYYHSIIPQVNITENCCERKRENGTKNELHLEQITLTNLKLEDLQVASHKLNQLEHTINGLLEEPHIVRYQKWYLVILSVMGSIIGTYIVYKCFLWTGLWRIISCFTSKSNQRKGCCIQIFNQCATDRSSRNTSTDISLEQVSEERSNVSENTAFRITSRRSISQNRDVRTYPDL